MDLSIHSSNHPTGHFAHIYPVFFNPSNHPTRIYRHIFIWTYPSTHPTIQLVILHTYTLFFSTHPTIQPGFIDIYLYGPIHPLIQPSNWSFCTHIPFFRYPFSFNPFFPPLLMTDCSDRI